MGQDQRTDFKTKSNKKRFLSKNKSIKIYKQKRSNIELFRNEVEELKRKYEEIDPPKIQSFDDIPLSERTRRALKENNYTTPTEIQRESVGLALKGHDILGAAKTGSGKTLAFVIPVLECLYCSGWSILDGLGAIIITPTRELAYQIFEVMNRVGINHHFSVALVIGGKDLAKERKLLDKCNILICTPGRLLQHMDENPLMDAMNMKILVLDEADRILDLGFEKTMNAILENLPEERQTLLFSATQTKSVKDLARLSLKNPVYVSVHEHAKHSTPEGLQQSYLVCEAHSKMDMLWSFIKSHKQQKILVFMASCKQVKFACESICRLRPGVSIMALYGSLHQLRRMQIYDEFCRKNHVVMLATDVASRGLDFPNVNWVVQLDCPEDVNTYIHRAGRTARFQKGGEALLVLLPSERDSMVEQLKSRKIPLEEIKVNPDKLFSIQKKLEAICARDVNLKDSAQRAFKAYLKNNFLMKDKTVFDVTKIDFELYAKSLGLAFAPRIRFLEKHLKKFSKQFSNQTHVNRNNSLKAINDSDSDSDDLLKPKGVQNPAESEEDNGDDERRKSKTPLTKAALAKRMLKKKIKPNIVIKFDEDGKPIREVCGKPVPMVGEELKKEMWEEGYSVEKAKLLKEKEDEVDKIIFKERVKAKHREERLKLKAKRRDKNEDNAPVLKDTESNDEENDGGTTSNSESDEDERISGKMQNTNSSESSDDNSYYSEENEFQLGKRKKSVQEVNMKKKKLTENRTENSYGSNHTLENEEELALHFLTNA